MRVREKRWNKPVMEKVKRGGVLAAFFAAVAVFVVMLQMEKSVLKQGEKGTVLVAVSEIPKGRMLSVSDAEQYFAVREVDVELIPERAVQMPEDLDGKNVAYGIEAGSILTQGMLVEPDRIIKEMKAPVIAGFKADDLYQVAGGILRKGDKIHVFHVTEEQEVMLIWENLTVQAVFDQAGNQISNEDAFSAAQRINIYLDKADIDDFYARLSSGTLRVVKVCE